MGGFGKPYSGKRRFRGLLLIIHGYRINNPFKIVLIHGGMGGGGNLGFSYEPFTVGVEQTCSYISNFFEDQGGGKFPNVSGLFI